MNGALAIVDVARRARRFYVGKRAGRHSMTQESIHRLMIRAAARGQRVVRLKGGDLAIPISLSGNLSDRS